VAELLAIEVLRATRYKTPLSVVMCDLDHFKRINDSYGHPAGDIVLAGCCEVILDTLRDTDVGGRWGGEEFLLVLPHTEIDGAAALAERVRGAIEVREFDVAAEPLPPVTVSMGVASLSEWQTVEALVAGADEALYEAKGAGRNRVAVARGRSPALDSPERKPKPDPRSRRPR